MLKWFRKEHDQEAAALKRFILEPFTELRMLKLSVNDTFWVMTIFKDGKAIWQHNFLALRDPTHCADYQFIDDCAKAILDSQERGAAKNRSRPGKYRCHLLLTNGHAQAIREHEREWAVTK